MIGVALPILGICLMWYLIVLQTLLEVMFGWI